MNNKKIGENIRKMRKNSGLTQRQLGDLIGKTESSIQKYEAGYTEVPRSVLELIADNLGVHLLDLLDDEGAINLFAIYDRAALNYFKSIGYEIEFCDDGHHIVVKHNGYGYQMYHGLFQIIEDTLRCGAERELDEIIEKHYDTKFKL